MMRYFNTHGPVNEKEHYVVPRSELIAFLKAQIEQGKYFTIYAPRQMGKTTLLRRLQEILSLKPDYLPLTVSHEAFESWSESDFLEEFAERISIQIKQKLTSSAKLSGYEALLEEAPVGYRAFSRFFRKLYQLAPELKVILVIDEFDSTPQQAISPWLQTWRDLYLSNNLPHSLHSVILIGIKNIATLNLERSSPFNIARQLQLPGFTLTQVIELLAQYVAETGQAFAAEVIEELYRQTCGHPFLVNRLAAFLTEEIATDRSLPISEANLELALKKVLRERNYNYETLIRHAATYREQLLRILFGARLKFTLNTPWVHALSMYGIIHQNQSGFCEIANPIYEQILTDYFQPLESDLQAAILVNSYDLRKHLVGDELQMDALLSRFREFIERRGREAFTVTPMPQEATGQYMLMAYLDLVVRQLGGDLFTEVDSGEGRLDLIVVYRGHRYIIETKIWYGQVEFDKGLPQLSSYLESEGQTTGYYVVFHARPRVYGKLTYDELEFTLEQDGKTIHVYLVRLGEFFSKKAKNEKE